MDSSFDRYAQSATFHTLDGSPFPVSIADINEVVEYNTKVSINYGVQLGASIVALGVVGLLTHPEKRRSIVFSLNVTALICSVVRMLCMSIYFTTDWSDAYRLFSGDFDGIPASAYANSILGIVMTTVLLICIELSLLVQTQAVCTAMRRLHMFTILGVSVTVVLATLALRFIWMVENCNTIMNAARSDGFVWLQSANNIAIMVSVFYFSVIFIAKLGYIIYTRKKLGITNFGPMQVIFIMSCQTMTVPALLSIITYFVDEFELNQNVLTLMAISLPLTSIWATTTVRNQAEAAAANPESQRLRLWTNTVGSGDKKVAPSISDRTLVHSMAGGGGMDIEKGGVPPDRNYSLSSEL